ncbi:MAG: hypothetical protein ACAI38_25150 [Myxococcota bacterium]|nr:hypothetical protein [Myxococcota bacterium]
MGSTCNLVIPGNPLAGFNANVAVTGNQVTITGNDWHHVTRLNFDANSAGYSRDESWTGGLLGYTSSNVAGGRPVTTELGRMANQVSRCGVQLRQQGNTEGADVLARIARNLRSGTVTPPK